MDRTTVVSQALVHALSEGAIDAADCARGGSVAAACAGQHNSSAEVHAGLAVLASIVALCIHDFLNAQLATLVQQRTNVQTVQRAVLDRLRVLSHLLTAHAPHIARQTRNTNVSTMDLTHGGCLHVCLSKMDALALPVRDHEQLIVCAAPSSSPCCASPHSNNSNTVTPH